MAGTASRTDLRLRGQYRRSARRLRRRRCPRRLSNASPACPGGARRGRGRVHAAPPRRWLISCRRRPGGCWGPARATCARPIRRAFLAGGFRLGGGPRPACAATPGTRPAPGPPLRRGPHAFLDARPSGPSARPGAWASADPRLAALEPRLRLGRRGAGTPRVQSGLRHRPTQPARLRRRGCRDRRRPGAGQGAALGEGPARAASAAAAAGVAGAAPGRRGEQILARALGQLATRLPRAIAMKAAMPAAARRRRWSSTST